ncbi:MAG: SDR family NAD(P)-dependent oxidoreductase [Candidatus Nanoarchaeia archaeon]|nr:SDR family NAD(P)-dependent oxidoreductase [Candidatus Nanoarchaeia archaeon]MDD5741064.1 SDR family NAD(P)-dependent oxidoreductase [Candidatus Nanoarchaeia archaeon]
MTDLFDLTGKVAIVTGAARGIGQSIAIELARQGADVVVSDIIPEEGTIVQIKKLKRKAIYVKTDISKKKEVENLINETIKQFKKIDILVNNAGIYIAGNVSDFPEENWDKTMNINVKGPFLCSQAALKYMKKGASIINVSSVAGIEGSAGGAAYCASKGAIRLFTKALAAEVGALGIRVNSIHPGLIDTPMTTGLDKKMKDAMLSKFLLKRVGQPVDIAGPAVFLASDASAYMTGSEIVADGGWICAL